MDDHIRQLRRQAMALPTQPGVYLMKDERDHIIYVGKAKVLKNRVSQYFGSDTNHSPKVRKMVAQVHHFDYIVTDSEFEALVLECSLIKQYSPKYNILLKDDKGYHYIRITPPPYSRISEAKQMAEDGSRYIGPYISSYVVKQSVDQACKCFQLATCDKHLAYGKPQGRPCLNHYIGQCCAPCTGKVREQDYAEQVDDALELLTQGKSHVLTDLQERMEQAAEQLRFEEAARLRDRIAAIRRLSEKQKVVMSPVEEQDVIAAAVGQSVACFEVFRFSGGRLYDQESFLIDVPEDMAAARGEFLRRYYTLRDSIPPRITMDDSPEDSDLLERWLSERAGRRVHIALPQKGEQAHLVELCRENAAEQVARREGGSGRATAALDELARLLGLSAPPVLIEAYDISNTGGEANVAGMVVFENGRPLKSAYRRFSIKTVQGQDDYASMCEVLTRRMEEYEQHKQEGEGFGRLPDLILLDGGAGHVSVVKPVVDRYGYKIPVFGMVKDSKHRTRAIASDDGEIAISVKRSVFTLISDIQEEVHRWAIAYHRKKRGKTVVGSTLTKIPGIGPTRANALLRQFGSLEAVKRADRKQLLNVKGMTLPAVESLLRYFQGEE